MRYTIHVKIILEDDIDPETLYSSINPENSTLPEGEITSKILEGKLVTEISGKIKLGMVMNTIDDVLKAAILTIEIVKSS